MGYYTYHTLSLVNETELDMYVLEQLDEYIEAHPDIRYAVGIYKDEFSSRNSCKWYDHHIDMCAMSTAFPEILFSLHGEGEESGDLWIEYYKNGKCQSCPGRIVFDPYDESKLV